MFQRMFHYLTWRYHRYQDCAFDKRHKLDTGQGDSSYLQLIASENVKFAVPYEPVQIFMFRRMLGELTIDFTDYVFLDLGSGKGRALFLAAQYNFSRIIGVEFSLQLHMVAETNLKAYQHKVAAHNRIELICQDAADYEFPQQNIVLFLYNPFFGTAMQSVVNKISRFVASESHDFVLLYRNPHCSDLIDCIQGLDVIASNRSFRIYMKRQVMNNRDF